MAADRLAPSMTGPVVRAVTQAAAVATAVAHLRITETRLLSRRSSSHPSRTLPEMRATGPDPRVTMDPAPGGLMPDPTDRPEGLRGPPGKMVHPLRQTALLEARALPNRPMSLAVASPAGT